MERAPKQKKSFYEILGVDSSASHEEISAAFRNLSKELHPDNIETGDEERYKEISEAYTTLKKSKTNLQYEGARQGGGSNESNRPEGRSRLDASNMKIYRTDNNKLLIMHNGSQTRYEYDDVTKGYGTDSNYYIGYLPYGVHLVSLDYNIADRVIINVERFKSIKYKNGILVGESSFNGNLHKYLLDQKSGKRLSYGHDEIKVIDGNIIGVFKDLMEILSSKTGHKAEYNFYRIEIEDDKLVGFKKDGSKTIINEIYS